MANAERKARKRAHIPFTRKPKEGTPFEKRVIQNSKQARKIREAIKIRDHVDSSDIEVIGSNV